MTDDRLPPAMREALDAPFTDNWTERPPESYERADRAWAMATALRWAHQGSYESRWHQKRGCENCMAIAALEQEAEP